MVRQCRLGAALVCLLVIGGHAASASDDLTKHHALSLIDAPKYGPDFTHFDWVNPNAPKGGRVRQWVMGTFDTLNRFPDNKGRPAVAVDLIYDRLMVSSPDEPATAYGHIAEWVSYPADFSSATVHLRAERALPRRQAHHGRRRHLLADGAQEGLPLLRRLLQERDGGREDRRSRGDVPVRRQGQPRAAHDHLRAAGAAQALLAGHGRQRRAARPRQVDARDPPGLGSLPHQGDRCRAQHHLRARQGLVGEGLAGLQGPMELRRAQVRLLPQQDLRLRGLQGGQPRVLVRDRARRTGRPASTSTRSRAGW